MYDEYLTEPIKSSNKGTDAEPLKRKLSEVLSEGLLDSVLPYLMQHAAVSIKKPSSKNSGKYIFRINIWILNIHDKLIVQL